MDKDVEKNFRHLIEQIANVQMCIQKKKKHGMLHKHIVVPGLVLYNIFMMKRFSFIYP